MKNFIPYLLFIALTGMISGGCSNDKSAENNLPNIIIINFDDLGYGDVGAYGATELKTPAIDRLANEGLKFTRAYAASATCTPSRYALLTGLYPWRKEGARILSGMAPMLIDSTENTLPAMLQHQGYYTGIVGKWHLGLGDGNINWNERISPAPNERGFNYSYILAATQDRVPTVYIENGVVQGLDPGDPIQVSYEANFEGEPTALDHPEMLKMKWHHGHNNSIVNGIPRIGFMKGGESVRWKDEDMADTFLDQARKFIVERPDKPFFLYYALQQPHVPRTPHPRFVGSSGMGPRGDVIVEADWCVGELMELLDQEGLLSNTLIILTSDNGPVINDGYYDQAVELLGDHNPSGPFRGGKYSLFEAGTRVPFITYWKGKIEPGTSDAMVSQLDLFTSLARLTGSSSTAPDSEDLLQVLLGASTDGRSEMIIEAGRRTALRLGNYVMIPPYPGPKVYANVNIESGNDSIYQLYNLVNDPAQRKNLASEDSTRLNEMINRYNEITEPDRQAGSLK